MTSDAIKYAEKMAYIFKSNWEKGNYIIQINFSYKCLIKTHCNQRQIAELVTKILFNKGEGYVVHNTARHNYVVIVDNNEILLKNMQEYIKINCGYIYFDDIDQFLSY